MTMAGTCVGGSEEGARRDVADGDLHVPVLVAAPAVDPPVLLPVAEPRVVPHDRGSLRHLPVQL